MPSSNGFFEALFDFSFSSFITSRLVKVLYGLSVVVAGLVALGIIVFGFKLSSAAGLIALVIVAPLYFFIMVIYARVMMELIIVVFRIAEHAGRIAEQTAQISGNTGRIATQTAQPAQTAQPVSAPTVAGGED